ncbi:MAG: hypothetical protein RL346_935 [Verrucomicrobiota bacterium]|jgi:hypothetical protein
MRIHKGKTISPLLAAWACMLVPVISPAGQGPGTRETIKSYCIDFNWDFGSKAGFAKP